MIGIIGAICGDAIGVPYEFYQGTNIKTTDFELVTKDTRISDDSIHTLAIAYWLMHTDRSAEALSNKIVEFTNLYSGYGYGGLMAKYCLSYKKLRPYNSWGNGSGMRVSPVAWVAQDIDECLELAELSASVSHNHPEGIKGAKAVAIATWMNRNGYSKDAIKANVVDLTGYDLDRKIDDIRPTYHFEVSCQKSVPESILCWLESNSYEECIRNAISMGGDADTMACMAGAICNANPETQISDELVAKILMKEDGAMMDNFLRDIFNEFHERYEI